MSELTGHPGSLPDLKGKTLADMNVLLEDKPWRIKLPAGFLRNEKADRVNPDFVLYTLNDFMGHLQNCVAATRKILPPEESSFYTAYNTLNPIGFRTLIITSTVDIKLLGTLTGELQARSRDLMLVHLIPLVYVLFRSLIKVYYLGAAEIGKQYRTAYNWMCREFVPADPDGLKKNTAQAIEEWNYIFNTVIPAFYPLLLRMSAQQFYSMNQLFYAKGSLLLQWLNIRTDEVLFIKEGDKSADDTLLRVTETRVPVKQPEEKKSFPDTVREGLALLEDLFPEAGWKNLEYMPDFCPYFLPVLNFQDAFIQLAPDNPLHQTLILFWILEELFQGLRQIKFETLPSISIQDESEDINRILEDWILYQEIVLDKSFSNDLKSFTHQIYTQPDFSKSPYGRKLLSNMYSLIKAVFLPHFDIRLYGISKPTKDDRLPPFYSRVVRLRRLLDRYYEAIVDAADKSDVIKDGSVPGILNPWDAYKFDIPNVVSRRLDALCGGKTSKMRTNALLVRVTLMILNVLDWWINSRDSFAYRATPDYMYRVIEPGSSVPAFGVTSRTDIDAVFVKHLKSRAGSISLSSRW